jgi:MYXO-CTERM domain-containing protein
LLAAGQPVGNDGDGLCTNRHPRTALGFSANHEKLFLVVIDGRASNRIGMTCGEMIGLFQELGAVDAVNLDGGGSSTMWLSGTGVVNHPSDGSQRVVGNHLAIHADGSGEATSCPSPRYQASFVGKEAPLEMISGEEAVVWMEYGNDGNATWDLDQTRVGTQDPQDRESPFFKEGNWIGPSRPSGADHSSYQPGSVGRFTWVMVAPEVEYTTTFEETFQLVQEGVTWFGPKETMTIVVHPPGGPRPPPDGGPGDDDDDGDGGLGADDDEGGGGCSTAGGPGAPWLVLLALLALRRRRSYWPATG